MKTTILIIFSLFICHCVKSQNVDNVYDTLCFPPHNYQSEIVINSPLLDVEKEYLHINKYLTRKDSMEFFQKRYNSFNIVMFYSIYDSLDIQKMKYLIDIQRIDPNLRVFFVCLDYKDTYIIKLNNFYSTFLIYPNDKLNMMEAELNEVIKDSSSTKYFIDYIRTYNLNDGKNGYPFNQNRMILNNNTNFDTLINIYHKFKFDRDVLLPLLLNKDKIKFYLYNGDDAPYDGND